MCRLPPCSESSVFTLSPAIAISKKPVNELPNGICLGTGKSRQMAGHVRSTRVGLIARNEKHSKTEAVERHLPPMIAAIIPPPESARTIAITTDGRLAGPGYTRYLGDHSGWNFSLNAWTPMKL